jgi:hypothetical protein
MASPSAPPNTKLSRGNGPAIEAVARGRIGGLSADEERLLLDDGFIWVFENGVNGKPNGYFTIAGVSTLGTARTVASVGGVRPPPIT